MKSKNLMTLNKIEKYCNHVEESRARFGDSFEAFMADVSYQNDCCMSILQIGELCKVLTMDFRESEPAVPWRTWCGIRDIMAHKYEEINLEKVWKTMEWDIPFLKENVKRILATTDAKKDEA